MERKNILNYFLEKPGTFDEERDQETILNLASKSVMKLSDHSISLKIKLDHSPKNLQADWKSYSYDQLNIDEVFELIDQSYNDVMNELTPEEKNEIFDLEW